jgi:hypothetical protein
VQLTLTVPLKLLMGLAEIVVCPESPGAAIAKLLGVAAKLKSGVPPEMVMGSAANVVEPW